MDNVVETYLESYFESDENLKKLLTEKLDRNLNTESVESVIKDLEELIKNKFMEQDIDNSILEKYMNKISTNQKEATSEYTMKEENAEGILTDNLFSNIIFPPVIAAAHKNVPASILSGIIL